MILRLKSYYNRYCQGMPPGVAAELKAACIRGAFVPGCSNRNMQIHPFYRSMFRRHGKLRSGHIN